MIVATYKTQGGATVCVANDYMAPRGTYDEQRAIEEQCIAAQTILEAWTSEQKGEAI